MSERRSKPIYDKIIVEKDVYVPMRDGVRLSVDIYRPDALGKNFPALLAWCPYSKETQAIYAKGPRGLGMNAEWAYIEAGDTEYFVSRGYVHVVADVRGTCKSEGELYYLFSEKEQQDCYDLIEWIAQQPWCDGNVGMVGISYFAIIQYLAAALQPPHLKAIFPHDGLADMYRDICYQGGIPSPFLIYLSYVIPARAVPVSKNMYSKEELKRRVEELIKDEATSYGKNPYLLQILTYPEMGSHPIPFDVLIHRTDGPFYWERSAVTKMDRIKVPTYLGSEMHGYPVSMHLPGAIWGWEKIQAPKKLAFRQYYGGVERPFHADDLHEEIIRWYDYWLKGIDTGIMDEPPIKIWVKGAERWRYEYEWPPLTKTEWKKYYLRSGNLLKEEKPTTDEPQDKFHYKPPFPVIWVTSPLDPKPECLTFTTEPLKQDVEIIGHIALYLYASVTSDDADFIVTLKDVPPEGAGVVLTRGWLKASHRELHKEKSKPWKPYHTHANPQPVVSREIYEYAIEIQPIANLFKKGHKVQLEIWPCDYLAEPYYDWTQMWGCVAPHIPYGKEVTYEIYHTLKYPSYILLPIITKPGEKWP